MNWQERESEAFAKIFTPNKIQLIVQNTVYILIWMLLCIIVEKLFVTIVFGKRLINERLYSSCSGKESV